MTKTAKEITEDIQRGIAIRLHTQERTLLRVLEETSICNCAWEELPQHWKGRYLEDARFFLRFLKPFVKIPVDRELPEKPRIDELEYCEQTCFDFRWGAHVMRDDMLKAGYQYVEDLDIE